MARRKNWINKKTGKVETGIGESINRRELKKFASAKIQEVIFSYPNGNNYSIFIGDIIEKGHTWIQKEGTEVYSFSFHNLENIEGIEA